MSKSYGSVNKKTLCIITGTVLFIFSLANLALLSFAFRDFSLPLFGQFVFQIISFLGATFLLLHGTELLLNISKSKNLMEEDLEELNLEGRFSINP